MIGADFLLAFSTGLFGGFGHCIGMCGPIAAGFSLIVDRDRGLPIGPQLLYNTGRTLTYTAMGGVMGLAGSFATVAAGIEWVQYAVMIAAGILMVVMGVSILASLGRVAGVVEKHNAPVLRAASRIMKGGSALRFFPLGLLLGFLPCGLSYTMLIASAGSGSPLRGALLMLCFGAGTIPALLLVGLLASRLGHRLRGWLYRIGGILVILMGLYYLKLGIGFYASL